VAPRFRHLSSAAATLIALVALVAALKQLPTSLRAAQRQVETTAGLSDVQRELAPANVYEVNGSLLLRAQELIPKNGVFYVATGGQPGLGAASPFSAYWLLPRRHTDEPGSAQWILSYGGDPAQLGVRYKVVSDLGGGAELLRVEQ
jgi:hypothetical protein